MQVPSGSLLIWRELGNADDADQTDERGFFLFDLSA